MSGRSKIKQREMGQIHLDSETDTVLTNADEYYSLSGNFSDGCLHGFTIATDGKMTYCGSGGEFLLNGTSDLKADKVCQVNYTLFVNGVDSGKTTPFTFSHANAYCDIAITGIIELEKGDVLEVKAKSDTAGTTITVNNVRVTVYGG